VSSSIHQIALARVEELEKKTLFISQYVFNTRRIKGRRTLQYKLRATAQKRCSSSKLRVKRMERRRQAGA
jgi:hypothetical protein